MSKRRWSRIAIPTVVVALLALVLVLRCQTQQAARPPKPAAPAQAGLNVSKVALDATARPVALGTTVGARRTYQTAFSNVTRLDIATLSATPGVPDQVVEMQVKGTWLLHAFASVGPDLLIHARLTTDNLRVVNSGSVVTGQVVADMRKVLSSSMVLRVSPTGAVLGLRLAPEIDRDPRALGLLKSLVVAMQVVYGDSASPQGWQVTEQDGAGDYLASYDWSSDGHLTKHKLRYTAMAQDGLPPLGAGLTITPNLTAVFQLDREGWVGTLLHDESVVFKMEGMGPSNARRDFNLETRTHVEMGLLEHAQSEEPELPAGWQRWPERPLADATVASRAEGDGDEEMKAAAAIPLDQLLGQIALYAKGGISTLAIAELERKLAFKLRAQPDAAAQVVKPILAGTMPEDESRVVLQALGQAGGPAHQAALSSVLQAEQVPPNLRGTALVALSFVEAPTLGSFNTVKDLVGRSGDDTLDNGALLAYGHMSGTMARAPGSEDAQVDAANAGIDDLLQRYREATTSDERLLLLSAIGNSGNPRALRFLLDLSTSADQAIRDAAVQGLRFQTSPDADVALQRIARTHPSDDTRIAAIYAIGFRPFAMWLPLLLERFRAESSTQCAQAILRLLAPHFDRIPEVKAALEWAVQNSPFPEVRSQAAEALANRSQPPQ